MPTFKLYNEECLGCMSYIPSQSVDMILADLPYGTTQNKWDSVIPLEPLWEQYKRICKGAIVLTASQPFTSALVTSNLEMFKYCLVWIKDKPSGFANAKVKPLASHEDVIIFCKGRTIYNPQLWHTVNGQAKDKTPILHKSQLL